MELRKHQIDAVEQFKKHYYDDDNVRGILSMCCGSGKTFTFYSIIKMLILEKNEKFFIYATSRILLVKSIITDIIEWTNNDKIELHIIVKTSDIKRESVASELRKKYNGNLPNNIEKILQNMVIISNIDNIKDTLVSRYIHENKNIIIITTYESSYKIVNAISEYNKIQCKLTPDLLVLDEAHNLVSEDNHIKTAKTLLDRNEEVLFNPSKYLFMTATPLKIILRNSTSSYINNDIYFSMDNPKIYGEVFYEYSFNNGIRDNFIVNFSVTYLDDSQNEEESLCDLISEIKEFDKKEQQQIYFVSVAKLLIRQIVKYNLKHTIVYISNQEKVKTFRKILLSMKEERYNLDFEVYYAISEQSGKEKRDNINEFKKYDKNKTKILLSVDMLNEGIDIPICDSILFAEERKSETVIVQNIGRALRVYNTPEYIKTQAYVILPTKIYSVNSTEETTYSSTFKIIREVCDILKQNCDENIFYKRKTKGDNPSFTNHTDDICTDEKSELIDNVLKIRGTNKDKKEYIYTDEQKKKITNYSDKIVGSFDIMDKNCNFSNITLEQLKKIVQDHNIKTLYDLSRLLESNNMPSDIPHKNFKEEWICYGDLLFNRIYSYDESIEVIKDLDLTNIESPDEWQKYYNNIMEEALSNEVTDLNLINKLIYIPCNPKTYYVEEWTKKNNNGWTTFLGKELKNLTGIQKEVNKTSDKVNAEKNMKNLINKDKDKVIKLLPSEWQTFKNYNTDLTKLKEYIHTEFEINPYITVQYKLTKDCKFETGAINFRMKDILTKSNKSPITINSSYKMTYDTDIYDMEKLVAKDEITRNNTPDEFIKNKELQKTIDNLFDELRIFIKKNKNN